VSAGGRCRRALLLGGPGYHGGMIRFGLIGVIIELALTIYALIDVIRTDESQIRGLPKFAWIILIILLPVVGAVVWLVAGKERDESRGAGLRAPGSRSRQPGRPSSPDDDPRFGRLPLTDEEIDAYIRGDDAHIRELEDRLRELDRETFPGEDAGGKSAPSNEGTAEAAGASGAGEPSGGGEAGADHGRTAGDPDDPRPER